MAEWLSFGSELFLLRMAELEVHGLVDVEYFARLHLWIKCGFTPTENHTYFVVANKTIKFF
jgi:hypothetical protein